ncbi:hypothetical protein [Streptomyces californicus]
MRLTAELLPTVTGVEVHEALLGLSDQHILVVTVDGKVLASPLNSCIT